MFVKSLKIIVLLAEFKTFPNLFERFFLLFASKKLFFFFEGNKNDNVV